MSTGAFPLAEAERVARQVAAVLRRRGATRVEVAGSIRRRKPVVGDIDIVALDPRRRGREDLEFGGIPVQVWYTDEAHWGAALLYATGPQGSNIGRARLAKRQGWTLRQQRGLYDAAGNCIAARTEEEICAALGCACRPPELRGTKGRKKI
jgi:DNA polymerase/3'-5' exonuclease PolX